MAELVGEGTFAIISVNSSKAADVCGASDKSGANVIQWGHTNGDAQIWNFMIPDASEPNLWQITCSLSGKVLSAAGSTPTSGMNVCQKDDTDEINSQRWIIEDLGSDWNYTRNGVTKSYRKYAIHPAGNTSLAVDVEGASTSDNANVMLYNYNTLGTSPNQQWIFFPVLALHEEGTYKIGLAASTGLCVDISGASVNSSAQAIVYASNDVDNQIFGIKVDPETNCVWFVAAHSGLCLDISGGTAYNQAPVIQWPRQANPKKSNQLWLPRQMGTVDYQGQRYPTYEIKSQSGVNFVMDCLGGSVKSMTRIGVWPANNQINQRFFFIKTERNINDIEMPGEINQLQFEREGNGSVTVSGLTFASNKTMFQARYMIRKYKANKSESLVTKNWTSIVGEGGTESSARSGWGDAWTSTFEAQPNGGLITMPFSKSVSLDSTWQSAEIVIEVRAFEPNYSNRNDGITYRAHGPVRQSVIKVIQKPTVSVTSVKLFVDDAKGALGIATTLSDSLGNGCERLRVRLSRWTPGGPGDPYTEWVSGSSMTITHVANETLRSLPNPGGLCVEFSLLTPDGAVVEGELLAQFDYGTGTPVPDFTPTTTYSNDDSCSVIVESQEHAYDYCLMSVPDADGEKIVHCDYIGGGRSTKKWKAIPPLNTDVNIIVMASRDLLTWKKASVTCHINSHLFIWNWTDGTSTNPYNAFASIIINTDAPPQQTRKYTTSINFNSPSGRVNPVAFSDINMSTDLSVEGVALDEGVDYVGPSSLPNHTSIAYIKQLIRLSGKGIHPIYRTPYGDWHYVGIESVDITKKEMLLCSAAITQRAVED